MTLDLNKILSYDCVKSTQDIGFDLIQRGEAVPGLIITARSQTKGRGKYGRNWESLDGNLFLTMILKPPTLMEATGWMLATGEIVAQTLKELIPEVMCSIKLPNDVMIEGQKVAGVLVETSDPWVLVGIGINVACCPKKVDQPTTYLKLHAKDLQIAELQDLLFRNLKKELMEEV